MRLLTEEQIARETGHSLIFLKLSWNHNRFEELKLVAEAEHKETLKAVGELLNRRKTLLPQYVIKIFLRGEMPEEAK